MTFSQVRFHVYAVFDMGPGIEAAPRVYEFNVCQTLMPESCSARM